MFLSLSERQLFLDALLLIFGESDAWHLPPRDRFFGRVRRRPVLPGMQFLPLKIEKLFALTYNNSRCLLLHHGRLCVVDEIVEVVRVRELPTLYRVLVPTVH